MKTLEHLVEEAINTTFLEGLQIFDDLRPLPGYKATVAVGNSLYIVSKDFDKTSIIFKVYEGGQTYYYVAQDNTDGICVIQKCFTDLTQLKQFFLDDIILN